jgi:hypothetical protein
MSLPISLMVDDPAPIVNVFWWHAAASQKTDSPKQSSGELVAKYVPVDFLREYVDVIAEWGIKGKFSVLPYPGGLGKISEGWEGCDRKELAEWNAVARDDLMDSMDITPEIHTHAQALDIRTMTLLPENERDWASHQTEATLTPYIAAALRFLNEVGLEANGVTSPWDFGIQVEPDYQTAIRKSMSEVNGRDQTWYFLHVKADAMDFQSKVAWRDGDKWLVSIVSQGGDHFWRTMEDAQTDEAYVRSIADRSLKEDGKAGRLADLFHAGTPIVFHTHWQSLYSNGRRTGLKALAEVARRAKSLWGKEIEWVTCRELARRVAAGEWEVKSGK